MVRDGESCGSCGDGTTVTSSPFYEALLCVVGCNPPAYVTGMSFSDVPPEKQDELSDWASLNANPRWAAGTSMIEAAELIVKSAIENGNVSSGGVWEHGVFCIGTIEGVGHGGRRVLLLGGR